MEKKILLIYLITILQGSLSAQEPLQDRVFFANSLMEGNYYYSEANYTAPSWVQNKQGKLAVGEKSFTPGNSLELFYTSAEGGNWEAKIHYHPIRGIDSFRKASHLSFWMFIESATPASQLPEVALGSDEQPLEFLPIGNYLEEAKRSEWIQVRIPIRDFETTMEVEDLNVVAFRQASEEGNSHRLYIDQIELLPEEDNGGISQLPELKTAKGYAKHVDITWHPVENTEIKYIKVYRSIDGKDYQPIGIQNPQISRFADYVDGAIQEYSYKISFLNRQYQESPMSKPVSASTQKMTDEELLDMVQEANFRYYWEGSEPNSGLALENIPGRQNMVALGASGFGIMALLVGTERNFISREEAVERFLAITSFLENTDTFHGAFPHFVDGPTGSVEPFFGPKDNGGDLVETSFLIQGLLAAQQYFDRDNEDEKHIRESIQNIWENVEWDWYRKEPESDYLTWHWSPDQEWVIDHQLIGWNETMITYLLAIASPTHPVPASMYYSGWASQEQKAKEYRSNWGQTSEGENYTNGNTYYGIPLEVGVSTGGPLFFIHYSYLGADPAKIEDAYTNYYDNNRNIALISHRYSIENPKGHKGYGKDNWGLTASDGPHSYSANEAAPHADQGKMTPTGALASFPYTPEESMAALKNYYYNYGHFLWGEYGFRDAFNLDENWCSEIFMGLNQAPIVVMIENHRSGLIWNTFMKNKDFQKALESIRTKN